MPVMPPITFTEVDQRNNIQHFSHQHPMPLVETDKKDQISCFGCQLRICSSDRVYGCTKCKYFLHESCAELPKEIRYPFHLDHGLLVIHIRHFGFECAVCNERYERGFTFDCHKCNLQICAKCLKCYPTRGTLKYEYHEHLLCFVREMNTMPISQCNSYDSYCKRPIVSSCEELSYTSTYVFYCSECDFKVHLLCGPLPSMVKHDCHVDPLILVDSLVEDNFEEYYCDVCETKRDPRIRIYYCEQCKYFAHVHCVACEIINVLTGDVRDVELRTLGEDVWKLAEERNVSTIGSMAEELGKSPLTVKDMINALTKEQQQRLESYYKWDDNASSNVKGKPKEYNDHHNAQSELGDEDIDWILELSRFTSKDFEKLFEELRHFSYNATLELKSNDLELKINVVTVKGYKIPHTMALVLKTVLDKYGDVSPKSRPFTKEWKSIVYFVLCRVLKRMSGTKVADLTLNLIREWFYHLSFVKHMDFEIGFARAHFEKLVRAFLGLQPKRLEDEIPTIINKKIAELQGEIMKQKSRLEKCGKYRGSSSKSMFIKECMNEASQMKWKDASEGLFPDHA